LRAEKFKEANSLRYVVCYVKKNSDFKQSECNFTGLSFTAEYRYFLMLKKLIEARFPD